MQEKSEEKKPPQSLDDLRDRPMEDIDPQEIGEIAKHDPSFKKQVQAEGQRVLDVHGEIVFKAVQRFMKLSPKVQTQIRNQLLSIVQDMEILLDLGKLSHEARIMVLVSVLQIRDDGDDETESEPAPQDPGDLVPA